jgi:starch-binding outer membrane protein, SusD/RagB family
MKKIKSINALITGFLIIINLLAITSCESILDPGTKDYINEDQAFQDGFSARSSVLGVYALMQGVAEQQVVLGELQADLVTVTGNASQDLIQLNEHNADASNSYADPKPYFKIIANCNEVMSKLPEVRELDKTVSESDLNSFLAELTIIRAWTYFSMVKIYGKLPYFEEPVNKLNPDSVFRNKLNSLQTEDFIIDTLISQLNKIDTFNLNISLESPFFSIRAKRSTIWALQGEMHLWRGNYTLAKKAYSKVITLISTLGWEGTARLPWVNTYSFYASNWRNIFRFDLGSGDFESQAIFVIPFSKTFNQKNELQRLFGYGSGGNYMLKPTDYIMNLYQAQKIVKWEDQPEHLPGTAGDLNRGKGVSYDSIDGNPVVTKFSLFKEPFDDDPGIFLYRDGDYHLGCCEAICRLTQTTNALEHLNQGKLYNSPWGAGIRSRVNLTGVSVANPKDLDGAENLILDERAMELAFEGNRWFDLIRFARHKNNPEFLATKVAAKFTDPEKRAEIKARLMNPDNWFLPLNLK